MMTNDNNANPLTIAQELLKCPSVTPEEGGALAYLEALLAPAGFDVHRVTFQDSDTPDVENLFAKFGSGTPHFTFAGHTDVVPTGDLAAWRHDPFSGVIADGLLHGRGAVDMKGGIAAFAGAALRFVAEHGDGFDGAISLLITGDEEGPSINGTKKLLDWAVERGEKFDGCIVGEPTNPNAMGDMIKIGRRGSITGEIVVEGTQGHVAYPHLADNPVTGLVRLVHALLAEALDGGTDRFQPSNLEFTTIDVGNPAANVIPADARAVFNIRFNDRWDRARLETWLRTKLDEAAGNVVRYQLNFLPGHGDAFLTHAEDLIKTLSDTVESVTGRRPELSTSGGTSDARFIKNYCPVVEFGLVGQTMHKVDEHLVIADLEALTEIYYRFLTTTFG